MWQRAGYEHERGQPGLRRAPEEFAALAALLERVQRGEPAFAVVGEEAGVGKTRLVGELAARADSAGFTVLLGHFIELGAAGLPSLVDVLLSGVELAERARPAAAAYRRALVAVGLAVLANALILLRRVPAWRRPAAGQAAATEPEAAEGVLVTQP